MLLVLVAIKRGPDINYLDARISLFCSSPEDQDSCPVKRF